MQLFQRVSVEKLKQEKQINMSEFSHSMFVLFIVFKDDRGWKTGKAISNHTKLRENQTEGPLTRS